ncbi:MAG: ABC transporter ATP-binding protein [Anaeromyxobacter sp.]
MAEPVLSVRDLCVDYLSPEGPVRAVDRVSLEVGRGEVVGVCGESGSGKSTFAQALLRILPPPAVISGGEVLLEGQDLLGLDEEGLRRVRWTRISMVFQSAMDALNPVLSVREQLVDALQAHRPMGRREAGERARELLALVHISGDRLDAFPHQLSGGMRQRVGIALALALDPALVILDEPTTALDVIVEREILDQLLELRRRLGFSVLFISHDLARMLEISDRVAVFYAAQLVEVGPAAALRERPLHPYTQGLLRAFPRLDDGALGSIPGVPPNLRAPPAGCRFHPRCDQRGEACAECSPQVRALGQERQVACHKAP